MRSGRTIREGRSGNNRGIVMTGGSGGSVGSAPSTAGEAIGLLLALTKSS